MGKLKKGDRKVFFGIQFTFNGQYWTANYISHPKVKKREN
jgi:hypothetical protein